MITRLGVALISLMNDRMTAADVGEVASKCFDGWALCGVCICSKVNSQQSTAFHFQFMSFLCFLFSTQMLALT